MKFFLGITVLLCTGMMQSVTAQQSAASRLKDDLFAGYDKHLLPPHEDSAMVFLRMSLAGLEGLDFFKGTIKMTVWLKVVWTDPRFVWEPEQYGNMSIFRAHASQIWKPDLTLYNSQAAPEALSDINALIYNDGTVYYLPPMSIESVCNFDTTGYPYDSHVCHLKIGSWTYDNSIISLLPSTDTIDLEDYYAHPLWDLVNTSAVKNQISYPCCAEVFEDVSFHLTIRRRETHGRIATSVIATWLILVVFLIRPSSAGERIVFGGFVFVSQVVLAASVSAEIPAYSTTRLGRFLIGGMLITAIVIVVNGIIYRFHPKDQPGNLKQEEDSRSRIFLIIDAACFLGTVIILAITTGALFA